MTDPVSIGALLTSIKTATDIAKFFRDTDLNLQKAESKAKIADLISALAEVKMQAADLQETILEKDRQIKALETQLTERDRLEFERPYYWLVDEAGKKDGPFCPHCKDNGNKLIRLMKQDEPGNWHCSVCRNSYYDKDYVQPRGQDADWSGWT